MGRRQSPLLLLISTAVVAAVAAACLTSCNRHKGDSTLVVGLEAQPAIVSQIGKLHLSAKIAGQGVVVGEKTIIPKAGESPFPLEMSMDANAGREVDVTIEAYSAGPNNTIASTPMLIRRSHAPFVRGGEPKLVRLRLESACMTGTRGFKGPTCPSSQTCSNGRCIDPTLLAEDLDPYTPTWAKSRPDVCKPAAATASAAPPILELGTGQNDYAVLSASQTLTPEKGPQGGHHLWIAARMKNLAQAGSTLTITAEQPDTGLKVPPTSFIFAFEPDQGGFCKLYGLRLQLDNSSVPVQKFLGQPLDVKIVLTDPTGASAETHTRVNVAATTIGD